MDEIRRDYMTLGTTFSLLHDEEHIFVVRHIGQHECKSIAEGTTRELSHTQFLEKYKSYEVERIAMDTITIYGRAVSEPALIITIGEKGTSG